MNLFKSLLRLRHHYVFWAWIVCVNCVATLHGGTLYYEDFSSGGDSLTPWQDIWGFNSISATKEGLKLSGNGAPLITGLSELQNLQSTSIRTQVAFDGADSSGAAVLANASAAARTAYQAVGTGRLDAFRTSPNWTAPGSFSGTSIQARSARAQASELGSRLA